VDKRTEFNNALKDAMRNKDQIALATIRLIMAALKDRDIAARGQGKAEGISDAEILSLLQSMIKQRQESAETYKNAGRAELAAREEAEINFIRGFLPQQMGEDEIRQTIETLISELEVTDIRDMGKVMSALKSRYAGQIDMSRASGVIKERLAS